MQPGKLALAALCAAATLITAVPGAQAGPSDDYTAVRQDYLANQGRQVTPCRFALPQLQNARSLSQQSIDDAYNGFPEAVDREVARVGRGLCVPVPTLTPGSRLGLTVTPRSVRRGRRVTFIFRVTGKQGSKTVVVKGANVSFAGANRTTDRRGKARITKSLRGRLGLRSARASMRGVKSATVKVRLRR
jgi:hypothetical protein